MLCSIRWSRAPASAASALRSGDLVLSPCAGCIGGRMANLQRLVFALGEWDAGLVGSGPCVLCEMGTGRCRNLDGVAVARTQRGSREDGAMCSSSADVQNEIVTFVCARYE